jgi:hypothetical protein
LFGCILVALAVHAQDILLEHAGLEAHFLDLLTAGDLTRPTVQCRGELRLQCLLLLLARHRSPFTPAVSNLVTESKK